MFKCVDLRCLSIILVKGCFSGFPFSLGRKEKGVPVRCLLRNLSRLSCDAVVICGVWLDIEDMVHVVPKNILNGFCTSFA